MGKIWDSFYFGMRKLWREKKENVPNFLSFIFIAIGTTFRHRFLFADFWGLENYLPEFVIKLLFALPWYVNTILFCLVIGPILILLYGLAEYKKIKRYQEKFNHAGIKNSAGLFPMVISVRHPREFRTVVTIKSNGVGVSNYQTRKADLEASFAEEIDEITIGSNPQIILIYLTSKKLTSMVEFNTLEKYLTKPHSFLIGESFQGAVSKTIESLPHMLIAGTTGGGKSVFFKQTLLGLLKTTSHLQLYLLDLKRGVEMKEFSTLPNVRIAKTEVEASQMLQKLKEEMDRRFIYMEKNGLKEINPKRDKMDKIVVGIDEASVLYTKTRSNPTKGHLITHAREMTDELAKLARAAGIHLILATQKVSKETIDTKVQENIGGRICFKMNTMVNSVTVLGNKLAYDLPDIRGRAIWSSGNDFIEIQTPFVSDDYLEAEIETIKKDFEDKRRSNYGEMIEIDTPSTDPKDVSVPKLKVEIEEDFEE